MASHPPVVAYRARRVEKLPVGGVGNGDDALVDADLAREKS
jgi:hypothetical protein